MERTEIQNVIEDRKVPQVKTQYPNKGHGLVTQTKNKAVTSLPRISSWGHIIVGLKGGSPPLPKDALAPGPSSGELLDTEFSTIGDSFEFSDSDGSDDVIEDIVTKAAPTKADKQFVDWDKDDFDADPICSISENVLVSDSKESDDRIEISVENSSGDNLSSAVDDFDTYAFADETEVIKQYIPSSATSVTKKPCCEDVCNVQFLSKEVKFRIDELVKGKSKVEIKTALLEQLYSQQKMGISTRGFLIAGQFLCKNYFSDLSKVTSYIVTEVFKAFAAGQRFFVHGNVVGFKQSLATFGFISWLKTFAENYGNFAPDEQVIVISACFTIKEMYLMYKEQSPAPQVAKSSFYSLFSWKFGPKREDRSLPCVRLSSYSSHSRCDQCLLLERFQRSCQSAEDLAMAKSMKQEHKQTYVRARIAIEELRFKALNDPENNVFCQIDDMDNHKVRYNLK